MAIASLRVVDRQLQSHQIFEMSLWTYDPFFNFPSVYDPFPSVTVDPMESFLIPFDLPRRLVRYPSRVKVSRSEVVSDKDKFQVSRS